MIQDRPTSQIMFPDQGRQECVHELFEAQVARMPEAVALSGRGWSMTYRELNAQANRLARHLQSLGVGAQTMVGLLLPRSREAMVGMLAILKSGGAYLPLDPAYPNERLGFLVSDSGAQVVLSHSERLPAGLELPAPLLLLDDLPGQLAQTSAENLCGSATGESLAYMIYTSGSTGTPKGVQIEHAGIGNMVLGQTYCPFSPQEVHLMLSSLAFDFSTLELWGALLNGARLAIYEPAALSLTELGRTIREQGVTTLMITPGVLNHLVTECLPDLRGLSRVLTCGDVPAAKTVRALFEGVPGCGFVNLYGPTENTVLTTAYTVPGPDGLEANIPIGRAIHGTEAYVMTDGGVRATPGEVGELWLGGVGLARGYAGRPELTAAQFVPHPFDPRPGARLYRTGDLGRERPDGTLEFLGRRDYQVKIRGHRIELPEIERVMGEHPDVQEAVVLALPQGEHQEKRLVAFVEVVPEKRGAADDLLSGDLRRHLARRLPGYMVPSLMLHVEAFPLGPTGKVNRHVLKTWPLPGAEKTGAPEQARALPLSATEARLGTLWADVLGAGVVGPCPDRQHPDRQHHQHPDPQADFFALGGTSLLAAVLLSRVATVFGLDLAPGVLFERPSIRALSALIDERLGGAAPDVQEGLVCLRRPSARNADAAPVILIGDPYLYRQVLLGLSLDAPIYAVHHPVREVTGMAASALDTLRRADLRGPYRLVGFSFEGLVAYELARLLRQEGEQVSFLGLIDTATPEIERRWTRQSALGRLALRLRNLPWLLHPDRRGIFAGKALRQVRRRLRLGGRSDALQDRQRRESLAIRSPLTDDYTPQALGSEVTLFRATGEYFELFDARLGWGDLTGGRVRVEQVRGGHLDLLFSEEGSRQMSRLLGGLLGPALQSA